MKNILCPVDFSEAAHDAIAYAAKLAQATGGELTLLNVQSLFELTPEEVRVGKSLTNEAARERLESQRREVSRVFRITCYAEVQPSANTLARVIAGKAADYDLIVMGTGSHDDLYHFFIGSNAYQVSRNTSLPVLIIPPGCVYSEISRVVYAYNYLEKRELPLVQLMIWVKSLKGDVTVLDVMEEAYSVEANRDLEALQLRIGKFYEEVLTLHFDTIRAQDISGSINDYMLRNQADVLALCTQHHSFIGRLFHKSVIKEITAKASYPVFVFHY